VEPLLAELERHRPADAEERAHLTRILSHVRAGGRLFDRARADGHLTGSAFILDAAGDAVLLLFHKKLERWLQPGGHGEPHDVHPLDVALREAREETGLEDLTVDLRAPAPFDVDVHRIPARGDEPAHDHLDVRYLLRAPQSTPVVLQREEVEGFRWVRVAECVKDPSLDASLTRPLWKILALDAG
jgi:8-oxo-dGTP pyrophosphatase MutT (NUDIX family)